MSYIKLNKVMKIKIERFVFTYVNNLINVLMNFGKIKCHFSNFNRYHKI